MKRFITSLQRRDHLKDSKESSADLLKGVPIICVGLKDYAVATDLEKIHHIRCPPSRTPTSRREVSKPSYSACDAERKWFEIRKCGTLATCAGRRERNFDARRAVISTCTPCHAKSEGGDSEEKHKYYLFVQSTAGEKSIRTLLHTTVGVAETPDEEKKKDDDTKEKKKKNPKKNRVKRKGGLFGSSPFGGLAASRSTTRSSSASKKTLIASMERVGDDMYRIEVNLALTSILRRHWSS